LAENIDALDKLPIGVVIFNEKREILFANQQTEKITGYNKGEIRSIDEWYNKNYSNSSHKKIAKENLINFLSENKNKAVFMITDKEGKSKYIKIKVNYLDNDEKMMTISDVTAEKSREKTIQEIKERLELAVKAANIGIWDWNVVTDNDYYNNHWAEMLGYSRDYLIENNIKWEDLIYEDDKKKNRENEIKRLGRSLEKISDAVTITDADFKIIYMNQKAEQMFGYSLEEIKGKTPDIFNAENTPQKSQRELYEQVKTGNTYMNQFLNKRKDGTTFICEFKVTPLFNEDGEIYSYISIQRNVTERKQKLEKLNFQYEFQKEIANISAELINADMNNMAQKINFALEKIGRFFEMDRSYIFEIDQEQKIMSNTYEWSSDEIKSQQHKLQKLSIENYCWWMDKLYSSEYINIKDTKNMDKHAASEQKLLLSQGIKSIIVIPMYIKNELFGFFGFDSVKENRNFSAPEINNLQVFTDLIINAYSKYLTDLKIKNLTFRDSLTGLYNRRYFANEMERLNYSRKIPISIIIADIDDLKSINDNHGHRAGDKYIKKTAQLLNLVTRDEDVVARVGGDEFAIILPLTDAGAAEVLIKRIRKVTAESGNQNLGIPEIRISLGHAVKTNMHQNLEDIYELADKEMYENKVNKKMTNEA